MTNMFDYLTWRGDLTFTQDPVNSVDALVFSTLSYIRYAGVLETDPNGVMTLKDAAEELLALDVPESRYRSKTDLELLRAAADTLRFGSTRLCMYRDRLIPEQETQFAAMTFLLDDGTMFLAFRGTDYSLVGWKEDFNMSFQQVVPAQLLAEAYVREVGAEYFLPMRLGGHSKGGNLAVFAAARSSPMLQKRILEVYNNDGPGFTDYLMGDPGYLAMVPRIKTFVPQSSVIGMLLQHEEPYSVIRSKSVGVMQHDPYTWEVVGRSFIPVPEITQSSVFLDATIKTWYADMTDQERNQLVDVLYQVLSADGVEKAVDIFQPKNIRNYIKAISSDETIRRSLSTEFLALVNAARKVRQELDAKRDALDEPKKTGLLHK